MHLQNNFKKIKLRIWSRIQNKIVIPFIFLIVIGMSTVFLVMIRIYSNSIEYTIKSQTNSVSNTVNKIFNNQEKTLCLNAKTMAETYGVAQAISDKNKDLIHQILIPMKITFDLDFFMVIDKNLEVITLIPDIFKKNCKLEDCAIVIQRGMREMITAEIINTPYGLMLYAVAPSKTEKGISGIIVVGQLISNSFLQGIKKIVNTDINVYYRGQNTATTLKGNKLKIKIEKYNKIIETGHPEFSTILYRENPFRLVFAPLKIRNENMAVYSFLLSTKRLRDTKAGSIRTLVISEGFIVLLIFLLSYAVAQRITNPIKKLKMSAEKIASGNLSQEVKIDSNDEIGELAQSFNKMAKELSFQKTLQEKLFQSTKMASIGELALGVAHEINNPLTSVAAFSESLLDRIKDSNFIFRSHPDLAVLPKYLEIIHQEAFRAKKIIKDLLDFAKQGEFELKPNDVNLIINKVIILVKHQAKLQNIDIKLSLSDKLPKIMADENRLQQVFLNLVNNAFDAMPSGGILNITSKLRMSEDIPIGIEIIFSDTGEGIKEKIKDMIFDPFFTSKPKGKGLGLGLSITYAIIDQHFGHIEVESTQEVGTTFTVVLPIKEVRPCWEINEYCKEELKMKCPVFQFKKGHRCWTVKGACCKELEIDCSNCKVFKERFLVT